MGHLVDVLHQVIEVVPVGTRNQNTAECGHDISCTEKHFKKLSGNTQLKLYTLNETVIHGVMHLPDYSVSFSVRIGVSDGIENGLGYVRHLGESMRRFCFQA